MYIYIFIYIYIYIYISANHCFSKVCQLFSKGIRMLPGAQSREGSLGVFETPFSYKRPLENSVRISKQVFDKETNTN